MYLSQVRNKEQNNLKHRIYHRKKKDKLLINNKARVNKKKITRVKLKAAGRRSDSPLSYPRAALRHQADCVRIDISLLTFGACSRRAQHRARFGESKGWGGQDWSFSLRERTAWSICPTGRKREGETDREKDEERRLLLSLYLWACTLYTKEKHVRKRMRYTQLMDWKFRDAVPYIS